MTMTVEIFDVQHGSCALVTTPRGNRIMLDCGAAPRTADRQWDPGTMLEARGVRSLDELVVSHADEDHLRGMRSIVERGINIRWITINPSLTPETVRFLKPDEPGPAVELFLALWEEARRSASGIGTLLQPFPVHRDVSIQFYYVPYNPIGTVDTLNDLSLVTFIKHEGLSIVFPGDLEEGGWCALLRNPDFCLALGGVNVFVAPHHGRRYFEAPFWYCRPEVVVMSDSSIQYDTQQEAGRYGKKASGIYFNGGLRKDVLTTRDNGRILFRSTENTFTGTVSHL